eukprot:TRINITY_DN3475_c0_g1_i1.p1 TRINITY_DN3475_c0_g1~~TRINITY_DN3475_c0_g1_i1.p1  ORF type:complete len:1736 (+),score=542.67 TRINITY_DN3475_c0_g1_i1:271-5478(+)
METSTQRVKSVLTKLIKESKKKHTALRTTSQTALDYIDKLMGPDSSAVKEDSAPQSNGSSGHKLSAQGIPVDPVELDKFANIVVIPLRHACESREAKLMTYALDCMQKLIEFGYIRGAAVDEENPSRKLTVKIVSTVSSCFDFPDDNVQLQILKAFFSLVASPVCDIHETSLLNSIRTCYNIYLVTRHANNQNTAKGILTQMINTIFQRMELKMSPDIVIGVDDGFDEDSLDKEVTQSLNEKGTASDVPRQLTPRSGDEKSNGTVHAAVDPNINANPAKAEQQTQQTKVEDTPESVSRSILFDIIHKISHPNAEAESKAAAEAAAAQQEGHFVFTDCYLVFRALCKLSMKDTPKDAPTDSIDMKSKILSLELLLSILETSGPVFRSCDKFINSAIKKYLIISLLTNGVSPNLEVFKLSLRIFFALVSYFKDYLKNEIGVFYSKIFLLILESPNSTMNQKLAVLHALHLICKNPQALVDIFVNYDCSLEHIDIFERMANDLSKLATAKLDPNAVGHAQIILQASNTMVTIMKSLVDWSKELRIEKNPEEKEKELQQQQAEKESDAEHVEGGVSSAISSSTSEDSDGPLHANNQSFSQFTETKKYKHKLQQAIQKFSLSSKQGMKLLIEGGFVENTPESIAKFIRTAEGLDKAAIGEYIGKRDDFNQKVLRCYVETFNFVGMDVDIGIRQFLGSFRIPGEAQTIDRIMLNFAEKFYNDHQQAAGQTTATWTSADPIYLLAFSVIMLATDLHNPAIKVKMTKDLWIQRMNSTKTDYDRQMLLDIFDRVAAQPITLNDTVRQAVSLDQELDPRLRRERFHEEMEKTITKSKQLIKEKAKDKSIYYRAKQIEHVRPMFEVAWAPMLAAFSVLLEHSDDPEVISLCLEGFKHAIHVSCTFFLETQRNTFVTSLAKFTFLSNPREMRQKNIESIKSLVEIARTEANYLQDSWFQVLQCISHLEQLQLLGSGSANPFHEEDDQQITSPPRNSNANPVSLQYLKDRRRMPTTRKSVSNPQLNNTEILNSALALTQQIDAFAVDKIFTNTVHMSANAIEDFVKALCKVSLDEIESPNVRMYSLQKLIELADFNMDRIRIVWSRIWNLLAAHFVKVGCNENMKISMWAIDALKQLAIKFLEKKELANYHFQKEFLKPFEAIMAHNSNAKIRDMVIRCLSNMIVAQSLNIKSGWKSIFVVLSVAASDRDDAIVHMAFDLLQDILHRYFSLVSELFFVECVNSLVAYGNSNLFIDLSLKAVDSLSFCAKQLAEGNVCSLTKSGTSNTVVFTDSDKHLALWWPILTGLSSIVSHVHVDVRMASLRSLFNLLNSYGAMFNSQFWELTFRGILLPIFDSARHASMDLLQEDNEWLTTTCLPAFNYMIELFSNYFDEVSFLLNELLNLLGSCILQDNESLARIGATCFLQLVITNGPKFTESMWASLCNKLAQVLDRNSPRTVAASLDEFGDEILHSVARQSHQPQIGLSYSASLESSKTSPPPVHHGETIAASAPESGADRPGSPISAVEVSRADPEKKKKSKSRAKTPQIALKLIRGKCTVQLGLIEAVNEILNAYYSQFSTAQLVVLLESLQTCYLVTEKDLLHIRPVNTDLLDLFLREETTAISCLLRVLVRMYAESSENEKDKIEVAEERFITKTQDILKEFTSKATNVNSNAVHSPEVDRILSSYVPIVLQILRGVSDFRDDQFVKHLSVFYPILTDLILIHNREVRLVLREFFLRSGKLNNIIPL